MLHGPYLQVAAMAAKQQPISWLPVSWTVGLMAVYLAVTAFINNNVQENYMDEPFHVPMTQRYCNGDFFYWDPKITTFPGLYVIGAAYAWLSSILLSCSGATLERTCSSPYLRSLNALLAVATVQVAYAISCELQRSRSLSSNTTNSSSSNASSKRKAVDGLQQQQQESKATGVALVVGLLPTQLFFAFLFYTDVPSLLFLLITELLLLRGSTHAAAAAGSAAIGMRQTNAVWVTFLTGAAMLRDVLAACSSNESNSSGNKNNNSSALTDLAKAQADSRTSANQGTTANHRQIQDERYKQQQNAASQLMQLCTTAWQLRWQLLSNYCSLLILPVAFVVFVIWNGGITLGDREAHAPTKHLMQPLYFGLFTLATAAPMLLQQPAITKLKSAVTARPAVCALGSLLAAAAAAHIVANYSLVHPYLVADNRHYTFYIWRKIFARHSLLRYLFVPGYVAGWGLILAAMLCTEHWLWVAAYAASCCVTLVPAWLIEFRYFTTPFALAILHMPPPRLRVSLLVVAAYACVNVVTLYVFAKRPYTWSDGSVARFMW